MSFKFMSWVRKAGYEVITKDVKYIKVDIVELLLNTKKNRLISQFDEKLIERIKENINELKKQGITIEQPKCNLDIEMALDIYRGLDEYDSYILISGDSDFESILKFARAEGKHITIISLRKFTSGEVIKNSDLYVNLKSLEEGVAGLLYTKKGKKN